MMTKREILANKAAGLPVWYIEPWADRIVRAKVQNIKISNGMEYAELRGMGSSKDSPVDFIGTEGRQFEKLFKSREALEKHIAAENAARAAEIRAQIQTKDDMIQFMFDHTVSCAEEYTDWFARKTVKQIALEKWGIKLD